MSLELDPFSAPSPDELAALFPGYEVSSLIACGGMGAVYHARQIALDREVAIKILPREYSRDEAFRDGFAAEARAMAKLNHPNLIGVYDFGEVDGMLFIIMEYVPGESLYHASYQTMVESSEVARLMSEICSGIAEAHRVGLLHRDIKPANVLLDTHLRPKVGDFGLARPIGTAELEGEIIFGTPGYTAPEVLNQPTKVDARADVFSLGVMLHELLTGKMPSSDSRPPSAISGCSPKFDEIVKRATQTLPELRYPDAGAMAADLKALAASLTQRVSQGVKVGVPTVRRPRASTVVVKSSGSHGLGWIALLLLLGAGGWYYYTHIHTKPPVTPESKQHEEPKKKSIIIEEIKPTEGVAPKPKADLPGMESGKVTPDERNVFGTLISGSSSSQTSASQSEIEPFMNRAKEIMKKRSQEQIQVRSKALLANIENFERKIDRTLRKEKPAVTKEASRIIQSMKDRGNRIPDLVEIDGVSKKEYADLLEDAHKTQDAVDEKYYQDLQANAQLYIKGINFEIERRQQAGDTGAVTLLKEEIERVNSDPHYFGKLIDR